MCVLSVQGEGPALYVSWQGEVTSGRQEALEINGLFAAKHGLQQGQEVREYCSCDITQKFQIEEPLELKYLLTNLGKSIEELTWIIYII